MRVSCGRPLLGDCRARAGLTLAACAVIVVTLGLLFAGQAGPDGFDNAVDSPVVAFLAGRGTLPCWLALRGTLVPAVGISAVIAVGCLARGRANGAVLAVAAVPAATGLDDALLKHLFHRTYLGQLAFPSGHATAAAALAATLAVLLLIPPQPSRTRTARVTLVATACAVAGLVAAGVIGLRWHYFTDTVAGAAVGVGTVLALALLLDLALPGPEGDRQRHRPAVSRRGRRSALTRP
jgi:membrane-associated phospholipid phosphatase